VSSTANGFSRLRRSTQQPSLLPYRLTKMSEGCASF